MDIRTIGTSLAAGAIGGSALSLALIGLLKDRWIERVRAVYAKDLEGLKSTLIADQKRVQASIDRSIFVTRTQFDTEFTAVKDIFRYATTTWLALEEMRPTIEFLPAGQTPEARLEDLRHRLELLINAFNEFSSQLEILSPFYPRELYDCLIRCRTAASYECGQIKYRDENPLNPQGYLDASKNRSEFSHAYREAANLIRDRLTKLSVID